MRIRVRIPAEYQRMAELKRDNRPHLLNFSTFMKAVIEVGDRQNLDIYPLFGYIEHELVPNTPIPTDDSHQDDAPYLIDYRENDGELVDYFKESPLNIQNTALMFFKLMMKLSVKYGNSIPEMVYILSQMGDGDDEPIVDKPTIRIKHRGNTESKPTQTSNQEQHDDTKSASSGTSMVSESSNTPTRRLTEMQQQADQLRKDMSKLTTQQEVAKAARKQRQASNNEEDNTGKQVSTNPMLGDFMDFE